MKTERSTKFNHFVVDASFAVKWFAEELDSPKARLILNKAYQGEFRLSAPELLIYEVGNALWKGKKLDQERISRALEILFLSPIRFLSPEMSLARTTIFLMTRYNLTFYDATYAGMAFLFNLPLLTADAKDYQRITEVKVIDFKNDF